APRAVARLRHHLLQALALARAAAALALAAGAAPALAAALVRVLRRLGPLGHDSARPFEFVVGVRSIPHFVAPGNRGFGSRRPLAFRSQAAGKPRRWRRGWRRPRRPGWQ